jgi:hypothetical protein
VLKLAHEIRNPAPPKPEEQHVTAPLGRVDFEGEIVSVKLSEDRGFGPQWKCTIKVTTEAGAWLAWGTLPSSMTDGFVTYAQWSGSPRDYKGARVSVRATLESAPPRDGGEPHFVFMRRPTMALIVEGPVRAPAKRERKARKVAEISEDPSVVAAA